jgi:hypothetical protein
LGAKDFVVLELLHVVGGGVGVMHTCTRKSGREKRAGIEMHKKAATTKAKNA